MVLAGSQFATGAVPTFSGSGVTVNATGLLSSSALLLDVSVAASAAPGARTVTVTNPNGDHATCTGCFAVTGAARRHDRAPNARPAGAAHRTLTLTGTGFRTGATIAFSGAGITVHSVQFSDSSHLTLDVSIAANAAVGSRSLTVTNTDGGQSTCSNCFAVAANPAIASVTPNARVVGATNQKLTVTGTGFVTGRHREVLGHRRDGQLDHAHQRDVAHAGRQIGATAPTGARNLTLTNPDTGTVTCMGCFSVDAKPTITAQSQLREAGHAAQVRDPHRNRVPARRTVAVSGTGVTVVVKTVTGSTLTLDVSIASNAAATARTVTVNNTDGGTVNKGSAFKVTS